jgi:hypothetical protein
LKLADGGAQTIRSNETTPQEQKSLIKQPKITEKTADNDLNVTKADDDQVDIPTKETEEELEELNLEND